MLVTGTFSSSAALFKLLLGNPSNSELSIYNILSFCVTDSKKHDYTMRVFHLKSSSGSFEAVEVLNPARSDHITPYPILQTQLYSTDQPGKRDDGSFVKRSVQYNFDTQFCT